MATVFFSYSHVDENLTDQLEVHLAMLKNQGLIEAWHDRRIKVGDEFGNSISAELSGPTLSSCWFRQSSWRRNIATK